MEEKYIKFYQSFHKGFQGKKSNSLFKTSQSQSNDFAGFYTSDPYDDEGVPILRITDIQKKYSALDGTLGS